MMNQKKQLRYILIAVALVGIALAGTRYSKNTNTSDTLGDSQSALPAFRLNGNAIVPRDTDADFVLGSNSSTSAPFVVNLNGDDAHLMSSGSVTFRALKNCNLDTDSTGLLTCGTDATGGAGGSQIEVGVGPTGDAGFLTSSISFSPSGFNVTDKTGWALVDLDYTNGPASRSIAQTITGNWDFTAFPMADNEVADNITASNYLLLTGGTLTGNLIGTGASFSTGEFTTYASASAYRGSAFGGDCDSAGSQLLWDLTAGRFSCETLSDADIPDNITITNLSGTNTGDVTLAGTPDYITISGQVITRGTIDISDDTNLTAGDHITLTGDDLDIDDDFLLNTGDTATGLMIFSLGASVTTNFEVSGTASISAFSLRDSATGVTMVDCDADSQALGWDATTKRFFCGDDDNSGTSFFLDLAEGLTYHQTSSISFNADKFDVAYTASISTVNLDWGAGGPASLSQAETITGNWVNTASPWDISTETNLTAGTDLTLTNDDLTLDSTLTQAFSFTNTGSQSFSGSIEVTKGIHALAALTVTGSSSFYGGVKGSGLTDCDADNQTVSWDATSGKFGCGDDDTGAGGVSSNSLNFDEFQNPLVLDATILVSSAGFAWDWVDTDFETEGTASASFFNGNAFTSVGDCNDSGEAIGWTITGLFNCNASLQPLDATLTALAAYNTNGILTQTAADTFTGRTITGTSNHITVSNGDGVAGNPTLSIPSLLSITAASLSSNFEVVGYASASKYFGSAFGAIDCNDANEALGWTTTGLFNCQSVYTPGGTAVALEDGGTGAGLSDPNADRIFMWDESENQTVLANYTSKLTLDGTSFLGITSSSLGFGEWLASASLDTATEYLASTFDLVVNLNSTGDFRVEDNGVTFFSLSDTKVLTHTGSASFTGGFAGSGLTDCDTAATSKLLWDATGGKFSCGTDQTGGGGISSNSLNFDEFQNPLVLDANISITSGSFNWDWNGTHLIDIGIASISRTLEIGNRLKIQNETSIHGGTNFIEDGVATPSFHITPEGGVSVGSITPYFEVSGAVPATTSGDFYAKRSITSGGEISALDGFVIEACGGIPCTNHYIYMQNDSADSYLYSDDPLTIHADGNTTFQNNLVTDSLIIGATGNSVFGYNVSVSGNFELTGTGSKFGIRSGGTINTALEVGGTVSASWGIFGALQIGNSDSPASQSYSRFGTNDTGHSLTAYDDLLISGDLEVDGNVFFDLQLTVADKTFLQSTASVSGNFEVGEGAFRVLTGEVYPDSLFDIASTSGTIFAKLSSTGHEIYDDGGNGPPTVSSCGTTPSIEGNDRLFKVTAGSGILSSCTVTFKKPYPATQTVACFVQEQTSTSATTATPSSTNVIIAATTLTSHVLWVHCMGYE